MLRLSEAESSLLNRHLKKFCMWTNTCHFHKPLGSKQVVLIYKLCWVVQPLKLSANTLQERNLRSSLHSDEPQKIALKKYLSETIPT